MKTGFWRDFRDFSMKGNVMDLAVGVVIGGAFGKIVSSLVSDIIMPLVGFLAGGVNFAELQLTLKPERLVDGVVHPPVVLTYGKFLQAAFDFLVIAFSVFLFVRLMARLNRKRSSWMETLRRQEVFLKKGREREIRLVEGKGEPVSPDACPEGALSGKCIGEMPVKNPDIFEKQKVVDPGPSGLPVSAGEAGKDPSDLSREEILLQIRAILQEMNRKMS